MKLEDIKKTAVIGAGVMGNQIAELFSRLLACEVNITDVGDELIQNGIKAIDKRIDAFFVAKGKMTPEEKAAIMGRIKGCGAMEEAVKGVDFVIEAIPEVMEPEESVVQKARRAFAGFAPDVQHVLVKYNRDGRRRKTAR